MSRRAAVAAGFLLIGAWVAWAGFGSQTTGDDPVEFASSFQALLHGHLGAFFAHLPQEGAGGSVLLRWPGAMVGHWIAAGERPVFRLGALECVLALGCLGLVVARRLPADGPRPELRRLALVALCLLAPAPLGVIQMGHPEEALGAALSVGAVVLAGSARPRLAGLALALAVVNKPWGVLALVPVLLALPDRRARGRCAAVAGAIVLAWISAVYLGAPSRFGGSLVGLKAPPWPGDVWWPFTHTALSPAGHAYRVLPPLLAGSGRGLAALVALLMPLPLLRRRALRTEDCLAALALAFLVRCALDPSNLLYYELPFVVALGAWEAWRGRFPWLALLAGGGAWLALARLAPAGPSAQFVAYLAVTLPFATILGRDVIRGRARVSSAGHAHASRTRRAAQPA